MRSGATKKRELRNMDEVLAGLEAEVELTEKEAELYLELVTRGWVSPKKEPEVSKKLVSRGMAILSGDGKRIIPVHPRLGIANHYRTWREEMVKEINERRMRVDKLIIQLIPVYEAAIEKRTATGGR